MGAPYSNVMTTIIPSGSPTCIELPAPHRGNLSRLVVEQVSGTIAGFDLELFDRAGACSATEEVSASFDDNPVVNPNMHRIIPSENIAGALFEDFFVNGPRAYQNLDEASVVGNFNSRIYLELTPAGSGDKQFQIAYTVSHSDF